MKVITFSRTFPAKHPKAGQPTYFAEKIYNGFREPDFSLEKLFIPYVRKYEKLLGEDYFNAAHVRETKHHTIRAGNRWKVGDQFSPRVWSGKPYRSKQVEFAPPITIEKIWEFGVNKQDFFIRTGDGIIRQILRNDLADIAKNDGLNRDDFEAWFAIHPKKNERTFTGQIICWNLNINY